MKRFRLSILITLIILIFALSSSSQNYPIFQMRTYDILPRAAITIAAAGLTHDTTTTRLNALATRYILECPNMDGNGDTTFSVINANGKTVWSGAAHPENATYSVPVDFELVGAYTLRLTVTIAAGTAATAYLTILGF